MAKKITLMCKGKKLEITPLPNEVKEDGSRFTADIDAPGQGTYEISELELSSNLISEGQSVACKVSIRGKNISQISSEIMRQVNNFEVGPINKTLLLSPKKHEVKGVTHPHWETENEIEFELNLEGRLLYCGDGFTMACMIPERYGVKPEEQIWSLEGVYQRGGGEPFRVKLEFDNRGVLVRKTGFYPASVGGVVSPFELLIEDGDTFEPFVTLINEKGEITTGTVNPILLGGGNSLHWEKIETCPGVYHVGVVVTDFDGQESRKSSLITIN
jgi:hypothetical protein